MRNYFTSLGVKVAKFRRLKMRRLRAMKFSRRHPFAVPFITFGILLTATALFLAVFSFVHRNDRAVATNIVILSYDHQEHIVPSHQGTVGSLIKKLHIPVNEGDVVEPSIATKINQDKFRINIYRAVPVEVVDTADKTFAFSAARTPRSIANQAGLNVYPEDAIETTPVQNFLKDAAIGEQVTVKRATPVEVNLYGTTVTLRTHTKTVGDLLKEKKIKLAKSDTITPAVTTPLASVQKLFIDRNGQRIENVTEPITMPVQVVSDASLAYGTSAIRQQGAPGERVTTYQIQVKNGQEVGRSAIQTVVTREAVTQIEVRGVNLGGIKGDMALAGIAASDYSYVDYIVSHESGWNPQASNASGAYGLCQALPGSKMASAGSDWATNPVTQLRWCSGYATGRYGSWAGAYNYWVSHHYW